jgi:flagellar protein FlgJ
MSTIGAAPGPLPLTPPPVSDDARLRKTTSQLEGLFVQRMFAAMRDTVPEGGIIDQSSAEQTFTQLLDEKMSEQVPQQWSGEHSLAQALYNQLRSRLAAEHAAPSGPESSK